MTADEKIAALRTVIKIARRDAEDCAEAKLYVDAERARNAAAWAQDMIEEIETESKATGPGAHPDDFGGEDAPHAARSEGGSL